MVGAGRQYIRNVAVALDQLLNALRGGSPEETVSSCAAKARNEGKRWGCILCKILDKIQKGHCDKSLLPNAGADAVIPD